MPPPAARPVPPTATLLGRALRLRCPLCGHRPIFRRWFSMVEDCGRCGLHFERVVGQWFGSLTINTILSFGLLLVVVLGSFLAAWPQRPAAGVLAVGVAVSLVMPVALFPWSRTLWTALDLRIRPLEAEEAPGFAPGSAAVGPPPRRRSGHEARNNH